MQAVDLHAELIDRANADLKEMGLEPDPSKRAWLGGRAQVLLSVANTMNADSPSASDLGAEVDTLLSEAVETARRVGRRDDAQYEIGKIAGLNLVRRLLRTEYRRQ